MTADRFIYFDKTPQKNEIQQILEDYIGAAGQVTWEKDRWFIKLAGNQSYPFKRVRPDSYMTSAMEERERWIEVHRARRNIDVITRQSDEYTDNIALGIATMIARFYHGRFEEEGLVEIDMTDSDFMVGKNAKVVLLRKGREDVLAEHPDRVIVKKAKHG